MLGGSTRSCSKELASLLSSGTAATRVDPPGALRVVVAGSAEDGRIAVGREHNGRALLRGSNRSRADELRPLLGQLGHQHNNPMNSDERER